VSFPQGWTEEFLVYIRPSTPPAYPPQRVWRRFLLCVGSRDFRRYVRIWLMPWLPGNRVGWYTHRSWR
jgi:hypothetical protein